ncbi:HET-domain-containing protein [Pyrenochaeta sp. DS3sAY3a]|nr:HET-domain-containing protein [Pyrenochaeta sp. DS3sAY3a]
MHEHGGLDSMTTERWHLRARYGLVLEGENNGTKYQLEFYITQDQKPAILPSSIDTSQHALSVWNNACEFETLRRALVRDTPLPSELPARVLDLGIDMEDNSDIKISQPEKGLGPQLYATLSHCWQREDIESTKTLSRNLQARQESLALSELPDSFRQTVHLCRRLGVQYLWIDSLCIVQDDTADWEKEAANMHKVYANAWFTVAMHGSTHGYMPFKDIKLTVGEESTIIHVRRIPELLDIVEGKAIAPAVGRVHELADNKHWKSVSQRGWCYQERVLSNRIIHFTDHEYLYEERGTVKKCQCQQHWMFELGFAGTLARGPGPHDVPYRLWGKLVRQYTSRMFGQWSDLLPGFAGVAAKFSEGRDLGRYIAGLWEKDLIKYLCWRSREWVSARASSWACDNCRPHPKRIKWSEKMPIPSWSWASRFGPCELVYDEWELSKYTQVASIDRVECLMDIKNPFLSIRSLNKKAWPEDPCGRYLVIRGSLYSCVHFSTRGRGHDVKASMGLCAKEYAWAVPAYHVQQWDLSRDIKEILDDARKCTREYCIDAGDDLPSDYSVVYLLPLLEEFESGAKLCLILRECTNKAIPEVLELENMQGSQDALWLERIGISIFNGVRFDLLQEMPSQVIHLM